MITDKVKILKAFVSLALNQATDEVKTDMLKTIRYEFSKHIKKEYGITVELIQAVPDFDYDTDDATEYCSYLEFKSEDLSVIVALQGTWSSYDGYVYESFYFCRAQPVTKLEYIRE